MKNVLIPALVLAALAPLAMDDIPRALAASAPPAATDPAPHSPDGRGRLVGGPCAYADHPGTATFLAVTPASPSDPASGPPYPGLTVTYVFAPEGPLPPLAAPQAGRVHRQPLPNGWAPGPRFLDKYGIRPGLAVPCVLRVIQSGTCTPVILAFPGIDLSDYFEAGK
jgi:hypothetical protein